MFRGYRGIVLGLIAVACTSMPAFADTEPQSAALMAPVMPGVASGEVAKRTEVLRELLSQYYRLVTQDQAQTAEARETSAGCKGTEACMAAVRQALDVDVVYHLHIEDQGYVDPVHLRHLGNAGIVKQYTQCNRCTRRLYRRMLDELLRATHAP
jgi:hypothetical protein